MGQNFHSIFYSLLQPFYFYTYSHLRKQYMVSSSAPYGPIDFALRSCESIAFSLHAILGITEPCTGCLRRAFRDNGAMPQWFWPVAGCILLLVAYANFSSINNNEGIVLITQGYIAAFHIGAVLYHRCLGHHPAVGVAPGVFVLFAFIVVTIRMNFWIALLGTFICALIASGICRVLVHPKPDYEVQQNLLPNDDDRSPEEQARGYT